MFNGLSSGRIGLIQALIACVCWGLMPVYFKLLQSVDALEVVAHRIIWSVPLLLVILYFRKNLAGLAAALTPVMAPARARQAIRERLGHVTPPLANDPTERRAWWRGPMGALAGLLAVAATAAFLWLPGLQQPAAPAYQAQLATQDQALRRTGWTPRPTSRSRCRTNRRGDRRPVRRPVRSWPSRRSRPCDRGLTGGLRN